ncbi:MAG: hypothetical protein WD708_11295 [Kiritimatiellia bacterium]
MSYKIVMIGAGSFFTDAITGELCRSQKAFAGSTFTLVDIDPQALDLSKERNRAIVEKAGADIRIEATTERRKALEGCDYVVCAFDRARVPTWISDNEIPKSFGVEQFMGENGGPGGQAHSLRNITVFMGICADMRELCPDARIMNFTNPMSFIMTYLNRYSGIKSLGFCHQVHGSLGVVSEMLGFEPGELQAITAGINHMNWLMDIRRRGSGESCMEEFFERVRKSKWWKKVYPKVPEQVFTLDFLNTFGLYPVGYDNHICEYMPFFYDRETWEEKGYTARLISLQKEMKERKRWSGTGTEEELAMEQTKARSEMYNVPFPKDADHPWYRETPTAVMEAFATNETHFLDAIIIPNHGAVDNLPYDAMLDIPAVVANGEVRSVHVGPLPTFAMELCRRQITIHELLVEACVEGDRTKLVQSMALDPYVRSLEQARNITDAFLKHYKEDLPQFA